jgi:hypothetical protein
MGRAMPPRLSTLSVITQQKRTTNGQFGELGHGGQVRERLVIEPRALGQGKGAQVRAMVCGIPIPNGEK